MVTFIDSIIEIFFEISNNGIVTFVKHTLLIILSLIIPFISYRINKSKLIEKIFRISRIPIISCKNDIEIIEKNCPKDKVVFVVLYIEKYVISGVLKDAQTEKDAFMLIKYWNKYKVYENGDAIRITSRTVKDRSIIVPMDKVNYYTYQYIGLCEKLPEEIF